LLAQRGVVDPIENPALTWVKMSTEAHYWKPSTTAKSLKRDD